MARLGEALRKLRQDAGLTLLLLADACGLSTSFLSEAERGLSSISVATLERVTAALGLSLGEFFAIVDPPTINVSPHLDILHYGDQSSVNLSDAAIKYRFLNREFPGRQFEVVIGEIPTAYTYPPVAHGGEELGYVLDGRLRLRIDEVDHVLGPGDSHHFGPHIPHGYEAVGNGDVRVLWVQTLRDLRIRPGVPNGSAGDMETSGG